MNRIKNALGMSALISHPQKKDIEEQIKIFASAGFNSFFLSCDVTDEFHRIPFWSNIAQNNGINFEAVHASSALVDSVWKNDENKTIYKEKLYKILEFCNDGKVDKLVLHAGTDPQLRATQNGMEFWKMAEEKAEMLGVRLCYENANTPVLFEAVVSNMNSFHGVCFDVGHQLCYTPQKDYIALFGEKIIYTHIHDNLSDGRDMHLLPKDGINNWERYFLQLKEIEYTGTLNLELSCYYSEKYRNMNFTQFAQHSYNRLAELINV